MASSSLIGTGPPIFTGENYHIWAIKMKAYLKAQSLWDVVENDTKPLALRVNPTLAQIKKHEEDVAKKTQSSYLLTFSLDRGHFYKNNGM